MMMIQQSVSNGSEVDSEIADVVEETGVLRESMNEESRPLTSQTAVRNWRQLFNEAELNEAYKQSINSNNKEAREGSILGIQGIRILKKGDTAEKEQPFSDYLDSKQKSDGTEHSDDSDSVDNLRQTELYSKVYMHKNKAIQRKMR